MDLNLFFESSKCSYFPSEPPLTEIQYHNSVDLVREPLAGFVSSWVNPPNATTETILLTEDAVLSISSIPDYLGFTEPYFELLGKEVRLTGVKLQASWTQMALGNGTSSRVFAIGLGYAVVSLLFCVYLNILTVGNARTAGLAVRNAVRQQLLVLKVCPRLVIFTLLVLIFYRLLPSFSLSW